ncbi:MAG TPA: hypothetical protein VMB75_02970 [Rhodocyclaceae bacterium]|nr:hypothetical protein [Rhodocyclaceae bacterium]
MNHAILDHAKHAATESAGLVGISVGLLATVGIGVVALSLVLNLVKLALS